MGYNVVPPPPTGPKASKDVNTGAPIFEDWESDSDDEDDKPSLRNFVPKVVLMKTGIRPVNAAKPKAAYNAVKRNGFNAVKASACWVWMPKNRVVDHVSKNINRCTGSGEARVQQRKRRIQRRVQQKQKDQEDEVFGRILSAKKMKYDKLRIDHNKTEFDLETYKRGLASVEERLVFYKKNEGMLCDQIGVLKSDASFNEAEIIALKSYIEKLKKEKDDNLLKINNYDNATKSLDKVIGSQLVNNNKKGMGYNVVPPPPTGLFAPHIIDLSHSGIEKFKETDFEGYGPKASKDVNTGAPIFEDWESDQYELRMIQP
ncbi:hypothetical protein Tco_0519572 [Tanacetum coccineum]